MNKIYAFFIAIFSISTASLLYGNAQIRQSIKISEALIEEMAIEKKECLENYRTIAFNGQLAFGLNKYFNPKTVEDISAHLISLNYIPNQLHIKSQDFYGCINLHAVHRFNKLEKLLPILTKTNQIPFMEEVDPDDLFYEVRDCLCNR